jgi:signal transduction histidine kinase/CheY-like chemotaxis protein
VDYGDLILEEDREGVWEGVQAALRTGEPFLLEYRIRTADGRLKWVWERGAAVLGPDGSVAALEGFIMDVSERRDAQEQLQRAQRLESVGRLAGGVAHDFNNVLLVITAFSDLIGRARQDDADLLRDLGEIRKAAGRAEALTRQLLAFSSRQVLSPKVLDLNHVIDELRGMLRPLLGGGVQLTFRLADGLGWVLADQAQLEQVLMNLAVNARDAMPEGGELVFETRDVEVGSEELEQHGVPSPGSWVQLVVRDSGAGMDAATQQQIFEPFFTTKELGKGTGLGLATVYGIVQQSGGSIRVWSEVGDGSTFVVSLPRTRRVSSPPPPRTRPSEPSEPGRGRCVLVVDYEEPVLKALDLMLTHAGYEVLVARDHHSALAQIEGRADGVDLLLVDATLPDGTGFELAGSLTTRNPDTRVVFMAGKTDGPSEPPIEPLHDAVLIQKPFRAAALLRTIRSLLREGPRRSD